MSQRMSLSGHHVIKAYETKKIIMLNIIQKPCAAVNYGKGRQGHKIKVIVIHAAEGTLAGTDSWFATPRPAKPTSAHYIVGKNGEVHQYVPDKDTAYHAGIINNPTCAPWITKQNPNLIALGIENEGYSGERWTLTQMIGLRALVKRKQATYGILDADIISHHAIADYKENMDSWISELLMPTTRSQMLARVKELSAVLLKLLRIRKKI